MWFPRTIVFDVIHHEIAEGQKNKWGWFEDPHRNPLLIHLSLSRRPANLLFDDVVFGEESLPQHILDRGTAPTHVLYISDDEFRLRWARIQGFRTLGITSKEKPTLGEQYACGPDGDSIIGMICLFNAPSSSIAPHQKKR